MCVCVHAGLHVHVQICVGARADVCHVFAVISFSCLVSQDLCYTVCSACQAQLRLRSNSQHCATVGKKMSFSLLICCERGANTHIAMVLQRQSRWIALGCFSLQGKT